MASKGLRSASLSTDTKLDADDNDRKPLKPLLAIPRVVWRILFIPSRKALNYNNLKNLPFLEFSVSSDFQ